MQINPAKTLDSSDFSKALTQVAEVLEDPNTVIKVTFWGERVVEVRNWPHEDEVNIMGLIVWPPSTRSFSLDDIAAKVWTAHVNTRQLSQLDRDVGQKIVKKIQEFYETTDKQIKLENYLTRFFVWLREFSILPYTPRFYLENSPSSYFKV